MPTCPTCQKDYEEGIAFCPHDGTALPRGVLDGRYRLLAPLGAGGMGAVFLAEHVGLRKRMAVKILRGELSRDATFARRFELEAIAASHIGNEHIVDVTDLGRTAAGELYYVMELLEGGSLSALLHRHRVLPVARALPILIQICRALEAAHAQGIVHRDVKPQNVMLVNPEGPPDFVKVVDFGISKVLRGEQLTETGAIMGTADYMAPEQARAGEVDGKADVYAVGAVAYELVTGTPPFHGENSFTTLLQHVELAPVPPRLRRPELAIPSALDALILHALAKIPAERPTMGELRAGLEVVLTLPLEGASPQAVIPLVHVTPSTPAPSPFASDWGPELASGSVRIDPAPLLPPGPEAIAPTFTPRLRSSRGPAIAIGSVVALAALGAWLWSAQEPASPAATTATTPQDGASGPAETATHAGSPATPPAAEAAIHGAGVPATPPAKTDAAAPSGPVATGEPTVVSPPPMSPPAVQPAAAAPTRRNPERTRGATGGKVKNLKPNPF